jgi:hypothetical protein
MNTITKNKLIQHHNLKPDSTFDLTSFTEQECWDMAADGTLTYDEADHMTTGYTLLEARAVLAAYTCNCDLCETLS